MLAEVNPCLEEKKELERDASGFRFLAPNGIYRIPEDLKSPMDVKSSYRLSKEITAALSCAD